MKNYSQTITLNTTADKVFSALTNDIPLWWTEIFEGGASNQGDNFTIRFGDHIFKTMKVQELSADEKVVWLVEDSLIDIPGLSKQKEWIRTTIIWEILTKEHSTELKLTHIGLSPEVECYEICSGGWQQFTGSLKLFLETGKGAPYHR
ncbi:SRPBCC family protein [Edaphocola aurantiacus]|uniref:SRPBCC family protein n=1 Tax=Edaphocola aurantiacus TaxID=2601682 RepID=UPI001C9891A3|nr:SRPBCC domain-containing protein [Edaphocola aurantiacus]